MTAEEDGSRDARPHVVLVVDDDTDVRETVAEVLAGEGYAVATAADGAAALAWLAAQPPPRLVLLDLMMPVLDGWAVLQALRARAAWAQIPVVVLSAHGRAADATARGAREVLRKPVALDALLAAVARHLAA